MLSTKLAKRYCRSPLDIPESKKGEWEITRKLIPAGTKQELISIRTALYTGNKPESVRYDHDTYVHKLLHNGGLVMSDHPQEMWQFAEAIHKAKSPVLVGGLGLGYIATQLRLRGLDVTVVEIDQDVIDLVSPHLDKEIKIIKADLFEWIKHPDRKYAYYIFDTWNPTGESTFFYDVVPLRRACIKQGIDPKRIFCWAEYEMLGQIGESIFRQVSIDGEGHWWPYKVFIDGIPSWIKKTIVRVVPTSPPSSQNYQEVLEAMKKNRENTNLQTCVSLFIRGLIDMKASAKLWEKYWGALYDKGAHQEQEDEQEALKEQA
jgi:hypothetical protein